MKKIFEYATILLLVGFLNIACQQKTHIEEKKAEPTVAVSEMAPEAEKTQERIRYETERQREANERVLKFKIDPAFEKMPAPENSNLSTRQAAGIVLSYFVSEPRIYKATDYLRMHEFKSFEETDRARQDAWAYHVRVMVAYGLFQNGNAPVGADRYKEPAEKIFNDPEMLETAVSKVLPSLKIAFRMVPREDRRNYMTIFQHTARYMTTFNLEKETNYLASLQEANKKGCFSQVWQKQYYKVPQWLANYEHNSQGYYTCESLFTIYGPDGKENPFRKAEAFVFRRATAGWSVERMKNVLDRVISELAPLV